MKDLQDVTDVDLVNVNIISIAAIFVIILIIFKSISLPVILVAVIEFGRKYSVRNSQKKKCWSVSAIYPALLA